MCWSWTSTKDLSCLFYSPSVSLHMQKVYPFTDLKLACNILCMCPLKWQDQCHLLEKCYPEGVKPLLLTLKFTSQWDKCRIEACKIPGRTALQKVHTWCAYSKEGQACTSWKCARGKNCELCKKHGGAHTTHRTVECHHYKKDWTPTRGTFGQSGRKSGKNWNSTTSYVQVLAYIKNFRSLSRKPAREARYIAAMRKVTSIPNSLKVLGQVVLEKLSVEVRNLKIMVN